VKVIYFTRHAEQKFSVLLEHGVKFSKEQVIATVKNPNKVDRETRKPLVIYQRNLTETHVIRVVVKIEAKRFKVITFYPGRKYQYA